MDRCHPLGRHKDETNELKSRSIHRHQYREKATTYWEVTKFGLYFQRMTSKVRGPFSVDLGWGCLLGPCCDLLARSFREAFRRGIEGAVQKGKGTSLFWSTVGMTSQEP